jgi:hypothetical protein
MRRRGSAAIPETGIVLRLENAMFKVRKGVSANSEFGCVAISLFFALFPRLDFIAEVEESSLGSSAAADSGRMPILVGSSVAISLQTAGGQGFFFACEANRLPTLRQHHSGHL